MGSDNGQQEQWGYANAWILGDNKTGEMACLELGLKNHFLERTKDGWTLFEAGK